MPKDAIENTPYAPRRDRESCALTTPAGHVGDKDDKGADRGRNALRSEIDLLTFCRHTPLTLCVSPMHWGFPFAARTDRIRVHAPTVAQDLADAAALRNATARTATALDERESKGLWMFSPKDDRLQTRRFFGSTGRCRSLVR